LKSITRFDIFVFILLVGVMFTFLSLVVFCHVQAVFVTAASLLTKQFDPIPKPVVQNAAGRGPHGGHRIAQIIHTTSQ
jgi:hypothetical protein